MKRQTLVTKRQVVYVVGGSGAIGAAISKQLLAHRRQVVVLDLKPPTNSRFSFVSIDLKDRRSISEALNQAKNTFGPPDALIFAAGYMKICAFMDLNEETIMDHLQINLLGAFSVAKNAAKMMAKQGGKIVFVSSIHGQIGVPKRGAYAMSKAALGALGRAMAVELSQFGIRVNVLAPGAVDAGMAPDPKSRSYWNRETPAGRVAHVEEIAQFAALLVSDKASFVSGQTIALDGGVSNLRLYN